MLSQIKKFVVGYMFSTYVSEKNVDQRLHFMII
jgi:hypothetical protein